ncbi:MAG: leucyl/phenylalanyl-tRNA--protein transferase [Gammaproteobacteria bacterium]|nr:leucyl/phenylalanyl-tRNA--protein transferase [Gammaproteobacteria bacterium]
MLKPHRLQAPVPLTSEWGESRFPDTTLAISDPDNRHGLNGLLAVGGTLSPLRLLSGYSRGIFPWYSEGEPLLWWSPAPRAVLFPDEIKISRSLRKRLRRGEYQISFDSAFATVIARCSAPRRDPKTQQESGTWITAAMQHAYIQLHQLGFAHSVECWDRGELVGGLYGIALGSIFFGESMFARRSDASKVALVTLAAQLQRWGFQLIDCQVGSDHLFSLGATEISRPRFEEILARSVTPLDRFRGRWIATREWDDG